MVCGVSLLRKLCSCAPLINEQAIEDPIYVVITKSNDLAENSLPDKAGSFGNSTTARIVNRTGDNDFVHLMHNEGKVILHMLLFKQTQLDLFIHLKTQDWCSSYPWSE